MIASNTDNRKETLACLIIDDPLLKPKYGCLDYNKLLKEMKAHNFFTEIAFIPWNYRRSNTETVRVFNENPQYYAMCVHGCNHVGNEFGGTAYKKIRGLAATALWRMEQHKKLTGLPYDPVIVFPQGQFSSVSMKALKDQGYFAAFNSNLRATDRNELALEEYHQPATRAYHDFPLFLRRYPRDRNLFKQDLGTGRPIIIVEHHHAFRDGYAAITNLVDWINSLGDIRWTSLLSIAEHYLGYKAPTDRQIPTPSSTPLALNAKVFLRRILSEVRDNYIDSSSSMARLYKMIRGWVSSNAFTV